LRGQKRHLFAPAQRYAAKVLRGIILCRSTCVSEEDELDERLPLRRIDDPYDNGNNSLVLQQKGTISIHDLRSADTQPLS
jgi:hypothetical protein